MMDSNFEILDRVREIHTVNRIPVTLSIGIVKVTNLLTASMKKPRWRLIWLLAAAGIRPSSVSGKM